MGQKAAGGEMGDELARRADQRLKQFASFGPGKVEGERFLRAVEIFPIKRIILSRYRPAPEIGAAANLVDADHLGPELCEIKRSEEHTSELQSLMRISYAVFCLKKKKKPKASQYNTNQTNKTVSNKP